MGLDLKYGHLRGGKTAVPWAMTASEAIADRSGKFVTRNTSTGAVEIADTTNDLFGWAEAAYDSASDSGAVYNVIVDITAIFRMPLIYDNSTYTVNYSDVLKGETCDIKVSGGIQYCDPSNATNNSLIIVGGQAATGTDISENDGYVDVMMNPNAMYQLSVGA